MKALNELKRTRNELNKRLNGKYIPKTLSKHCGKDYNKR